MQANQFITSAHSSDTVNFRVLPHDFPYTLLTMLTRKIITLICVKLYQQAKNQLVPLVLS